MKVLCGKEELLKGSQLVQTVVAPRSTLPVLSNFLFETEGSMIKLSSTDLEVGVSCYIKGEIVKEGSITIPAKRFSDIIKELPEDSSIEIRSDDTNQISIKCGKSRFSLMGLPKTDYPILPDFPKEKVLKMPKDVLKTMLRRTAFSVSNDESRYILNGTYLNVSDGLVKLVATDGRRLAFISRDITDKKINLAVVIPSKAINEIQRILSLDEGKGEVKIGVTENQIAFQAGDVMLTSRLIEGTFPNYEQVIPKKNEAHIKLSSKEALSAVKQMALLALDKSSSIKFLFGRGTLKVSASAQGLGEGEVEMNTDYNGENLEIAFNPSFLMDILKNVDDEQVYFELSNALTPALITPVKDKSYMCVVMPMRI